MFHVHTYTVYISCSKREEQEVAIVYVRKTKLVLVSLERSFEDKKKRTLRTDLGSSTIVHTSGSTCPGLSEGDEGVAHVRLFIDARFLTLSPGVFLISCTCHIRA